MKTLSLKQHDIVNVICNQYPHSSKLDSISNIRFIFGSTATELDIQIAYKHLGL